MPRDGQRSITVPEETYDELQAEREERGEPKWGVFLEQLLAGPDTPVLDAPEDLDVWREHSADFVETLEYGVVCPECGSVIVGAGDPEPDAGLTCPDCGAAARPHDADDSGADIEALRDSLESAIEEQWELKEQLSELGADLVKRQKALEEQLDQLPERVRTNLMDEFR